MRVKLLLGAALLAVACLFAYKPIMRHAYPLRYHDVVARHAAEHRVDPLLITAVMYVESGFRADAVSPKGAKGLMQLMPATAEWAAQQMGMSDYSEEKLFEPEVNVAIGVWYFATLRRLFDGDTALALAAYNGGRANVLRWLEEQAWSGLAEEADDIPFPETRAYVRKVLHTYEWYRRLWGPELGYASGGPGPDR